MAGVVVTGSAGEGVGVSGVAAGAAVDAAGVPAGFCNNSAGLSWVVFGLVNLPATSAAFRVLLVVISSFSASLK